MHPIEHLRFVARAHDVPQRALVEEAAQALASFTWDRPGLVMACRRLVSCQPGSATLVWLAARTMDALEPRRALDEAVEALRDDPTCDHLASALADGAVVATLDEGDELVPALARRGDLVVRAVDAEGAGAGLGGLAWRLDAAGTPVVPVPARGAGAAAATADVVLLDAAALGPEGVLVPSGSLALAAVAHHAGVPVWAVAGVGRTLPAGMWEPFLSRARGAATGSPGPGRAATRAGAGGGLGGPDRSAGVGRPSGVGGPAGTARSGRAGRLDSGDGGDEVLDATVEVVPIGLVDRVVGPGGVLEPSDALAASDCPVLPGLFRGDVI